MKLGAFLMPSHPPERAIGAAIDWDLAQLEQRMGQNLVRPGDPESALSVDYLIENAWLVGSPDTVTRKIARLQQATGGFGTLLMMVYDFSAEQPWWDQSLALLVQEVMPNFRE